MCCLAGVINDDDDDDDINAQRVGSVLSKIDLINYDNDPSLMHNH